MEDVLCKQCFFQTNFLKHNMFNLPENPPHSCQVFLIRKLTFLKPPLHLHPSPTTKPRHVPASPPLRSAKQSSSLDLRGSTPLHDAAMNGRVEVTELLIGSRASLDIQKSDDGLRAWKRGGGFDWGLSGESGKVVWGLGGGVETGV